MNTFVATIDLNLADKLQGDLTQQGFQLTKPPYTVFSAQKKGVSCTLYTSGKITVQGKDKDDFIAYYLEPEILQSLSYTYPEINVDMTAHIGVDEAGKGDYFGPLCIGGVFADETLIKKLLELGVRDSKRMSDKSVLEMAKKIRSHVPHAIVRISPKKYNELYASFHNLNSLLAWGHATAISELIEKTSCTTVLIDQFASEPLVEKALKQKNVTANLTQRPRAEEDPVVAAASILARSAFLEGLENLSKQFETQLPKGASHQIVVVGKKLVAEKGREILSEVAKLHFKTTQEILNLL
jgi:ribonuclease HIII